MSPAQDAVSPVPDDVSGTPDGESSTGDTAKPKAASKRKGKGNSKAKKTETASTDSSRDDAAHAEFIAQFPTTDPDAVEADATPVSDVKPETDDSETAQDPSEASDDVSADDKAELETDAVVPEVKASEAEVPAVEADDGEAEKPSADNDDVQIAEADGAPDVATPEANRDESEAPEPEPATHVPAAAALDPDVDGTDDPDEALLDDDDDASSWVRPYVWTGGRTETTMDFAIETLVSAREQVAGTDEAMRDEHRRVLELCDEPRSVTEIAALLSVPLGVAKTLLGAMVEEDLVVVHRNSGSAAGPDLALMERVLRGLKKL